MRMFMRMYIVDLFSGMQKGPVLLNFHRLLLLLLLLLRDLSGVTIEDAYRTDHLGLPSGLHGRGRRMYIVDHISGMQQETTLGVISSHAGFSPRRVPATFSRV